MGDSDDLSTGRALPPRGSIPEWTAAPAGASTPGGRPALFRSSAHAWFGLRLVFLRDVAGLGPDDWAKKSVSYRRAWKRYVHHGWNMQQLVAMLDADIDVAARFWNTIEQEDVDTAFSAALCERERLDRAAGFGPKVLLATHVARHYRLGGAATAERHARNRPLSAADNESAWRAAAGGLCRSCGTPTISQRQYKRLRTTIRDHADLFDTAPTYTQTNGVQASLWSGRVLIAAKGVADHVVPRSLGGKTGAANLMNVCAACNYSRSNVPLDALGVMSYS